MELRNSNTKINLLRAFAGESQARNRYDIAAEKAKKKDFILLKVCSSILPIRKKPMLRHL